MRAIVTRGAALLLLFAGTVCLSAGPRLEDEKEKPAPKPAKEAPLPPGAVVAVYENFLDAVKMLPPRAFVLAPDKYKALMDEIDRLKKQLGRPSVRAPSRVLLKGKIDGNLATLTAQFEFETEAANEAVRLACGPALATGVSLDGRTPRLRAASSRGRDDDGFVVEIDKPGDHQLTLDLVLAVTSTTAGHALALDLPRAAITTLELELPAGAREVRLGTKPLADTLLSMKDNKLSGGLGPAEKLDLSWRGAGAAASAAVLEADGQVVVRVEPRDGGAEFTTETRLTLRVRAGQTSQWQLRVPPGSVLKVAPEDEARVAGIDVADQKQTSRRTIRLKQASAAPLAVTVTHTQPAPKPGSGKAATVGPFTVIDAARQGGSVLVCNAIPDWHLEFTQRADLTRRGATNEEMKREPTLTAAFRYGPGGGPRRGGPSWLDVEVESVRGQIKTRAAHAFTLVTDGDDGPRWQVQTSLTVTPHWADLDRLVVQLPEGCVFNEEGSFPLPDRVRGLTPDAAARTVEFRLARGGADSALTPFTLRIEATFSAPVDLKNPEKATLGLPRPLGTIEQDGTVTAQAPTTVELLAPAAGPELTRQTPHELAWRFPRKAPAKLDLAWQPYRPPVQVASLIDLTLLPGEARVRQELRYHLPDARPQGPPRLPLRLPASIAARVRLVEGGRLVEGSPAPRAVVIPADARQPVLVLEYAVPLAPSKPGEPVAVPLAVPEQVTRGETRVRVWSDGGPLPAAAPGWGEQNIEVVPGRARLPAMVVRSDRVDQPLTLELGRGEPAAAALVERALVRVRVAANGVQWYHVSYRLARLGARALDLELPAPAATVGLEVKLDGLLVSTEMAVPNGPELRGRVVRLRLSPELVRKPAVLDVTYRLDPGRAQATPLTTPLLPPRLAGDPGGVPTRWQVTMPGNRVVLAPEQGPGTPIRWGLAGWLPAPRVGVGDGELERWFAGGDAPRPAGEELPSLVLWHDGPGGVTVTHAPRLAWLLACSLALALVGLATWRLSFPTASGRGATAAWLAALALIVAAIVAVLLRPMLAAEVAYGCLPGLAVLAVLGVAQWLGHERYRRQIVFLPSFSRARPGSSLTRPEPPPRPAHGEPSTVDVPRSVGSSVERAG